MKTELTYAYCLQRIAEVIMSCKTLEQMHIARKYANMVMTKHFERGIYDWGKECEAHLYINKVVGKWHMYTDIWDK